MFVYYVGYNLYGKRKIIKCGDLDSADDIARKRLTQGATDVIIEVTVEGDTSDWQPIEIA